jgi:hypothetical protein
MTTREDIKSLLAKEGFTITKLAEKLTEKTGKKYDVNGISQKLARNTLRYEEFKLITEILGYEIKLLKIP